MEYIALLITLAYVTPPNVRKLAWGNPDCSGASPLEKPKVSFTPKRATDGRPYGVFLCALVGADGLAAARSRSRSDTALWCHSLRSRRFATSASRDEAKLT